MQRFSQVVLRHLQCGPRVRLNLLTSSRSSLGATLALVGMWKLLALGLCRTRLQQKERNLRVIHTFFPKNPMFGPSRYRSTVSVSELGTLLRVVPLSQLSIRPNVLVLSGHRL